jgi:hypothetical protein
MSPDHEYLAKVVTFDGGPISAIGLTLQKVTPRAGERPEDMMIYTRSAALTSGMELTLALVSPLGFII